MYEINILFGEHAVRRLENNDSINIEEIEELGELKTFSFETEAEVKAFSLGIRTSLGWNDAEIVYEIGDQVFEAR